MTRSEYDNLDTMRAGAWLAEFRVRGWLTPKTPQAVLDYYIILNTQAQRLETLQENERCARMGVDPRTAKYINL